jgi:hypothetical protein
MIGLIKRIFGNKQKVRTTEYDTTSEPGHRRLVNYLENREKEDEAKYGMISKPKRPDEANLSELESKLKEISAASVEVRTYRTDLLAGGTTGVAITENPHIEEPDQIKNFLIETFQKNQAFPPVIIPNDFGKLWYCIGYRERGAMKLIRLDTAKQGNPMAMTVSHEVYIRS